MTMVILNLERLMGETITLKLQAPPMFTRPTKGALKYVLCVIAAGTCVEGCGKGWGEACGKGEKGGMEGGLSGNGCSKVAPTVE